MACRQVVEQLTRRLSGFLIVMYYSPCPGVQEDLAFFGPATPSEKVLISSILLLFTFCSRLDCVPQPCEI